MATRLKPSRINVDNNPRVGDGAAYQNDNDFHWSEGGGDMSYEDFEWVTLTGNSLVIEKISNNVTPTGNFTVTAGTLRPGIEYVLRVNTGNTPYTMTLGTGVTNPNGYSTELAPNKVNQFKFIATSDSQLELEGVDTSEYLTGLTILSYGNSTWNDFITAYQKKAIVYCRASSNPNPATGSQTRMAFMAYVSDETTPTSVEFQYYRSRSSHGSDENQQDEVYVYKLTNASGGTWTVEIRDTAAKIATGTGLTKAYTTSGSKSTLTIANDGVLTVNGVNGTVTVNDIKQSATAPANPTAGTAWYDTTNGALKVYNGSAWDTIATGGAISDTAYGPGWDGQTTTAPSQNAVYDKISSIDALIPSEATSSNKLADKAYVGDSINSVTAYYITKNAQGDQFATYAELAAATTFYSGGVARVPTRNDYTIVLDDENHSHATTRYIYNNGWEYQYTVNETPLTQAQLNALNSGITAGKVTTYDGYATSKQDTLVSGTNIKTINNTSILGSGNIDTNQVSNTAYGSSWDGVTGTAPSKNAVYDKINAMDTTISNKADASKTIKVFSLSGSSDTTNAQAAVNWFRNGGVPVILYSQSYHYLANNIPLEYESNPTLQFINTDTDYATMNTIEIWTTNYNVGTINIRSNNFVKSVGGSSGAVSLKTVNNNALVGSGNIQIDAVIKSATAPASATQGDLWYDTTNDQLKVYDGNNWNATGKEYNAGPGIEIGNVSDYSAMQGPAPDGFHVPLNTEWQAVYNVWTALGGGSSDGTNFGIALKLPFAGRRYYSTAGVGGQGTYGNYWSSSRKNANNAYYLYFYSTVLTLQNNDNRAYGFSVRCFRNSPTVPTSSWTKLYGTSIEAGGIFWSSADGLISLSSNGQTWITIADKNLGATTVWNSGDTLSETNCGKYYQWGNNYGFPRTGTIANQGTTQVDASNYGPGNYYSSDTFIKYNGRWDTTDNGNLWGGETGVVTLNNAITNTGVLSVNGQTGNVTTHTTITVTLTSAGWNNKSQTVSVSGVTASNTVIVSPDPSGFNDYVDGVVYCSAQGSNSLTFTCTSEPAVDIVVNVVILN